MIRYETGNLFDAKAEALVNTVNEVGVMGKGVALAFRDAFPANTAAYVRAAKAKKIKVGHVFVTRNDGLIGPKWIINFPTKKHWRHPSKIEWIRAGLQDLIRVIRHEGIHSIAMPPLGSGAGKLDWNVVRREIETALADLPDVDVLVFEPTAAYMTAAKKTGLEKLTPARALIAELIRRYEVLGLECTILEVQKLAWFMSRAVATLGLPDVLGLKFKANKFGPYDDRIRHLLDGLDGSYLHSQKRLADAGPFDLINFDYKRQSDVTAYLHSEAARQYLPAVEFTSRLIDGFESPFGMELLSTVDWLLVREGVSASADAMLDALKTWPGGADAGARKIALFDEDVLTIALDRLRRPPAAKDSTTLFSRTAG